MASQPQAEGSATEGDAAQARSAATPQTVTDDVAARLARRYPPPRVPRAVMVGLVAAGTAVGLGWLVWAALAHSTPAVTAQVSGFEIVSDTTVRVTMTVQRPDPSIPALCRVIAQSQDFQPVAEQEVRVPASALELADLKLELTTLRRATSASVTSCQTG